jgi:hypothetical protein
MAKRQNLSLNPAKISGLCGRLMCCLSHEVELYPSNSRNRGRGPTRAPVRAKPGKTPHAGSDNLITEPTDFSCFRNTVAAQHGARGELNV